MAVLSTVMCLYNIVSHLTHFLQTGDDGKHFVVYPQRYATKGLYYLSALIFVALLARWL